MIVSSEVPSVHQTEHPTFDSPSANPDASVILTDVIDEAGPSEVLTPQKARILNLSFWSPELATLFLRIGIAFIYLYAALSMWLDPPSFAKWLPDFLLNTSVVSLGTILRLFSLYELVLALWLLSGKGLFYVSILSMVTLFCIVLFNLDSFDVLFRNVAIMFASMALAVMSGRPSMFNPRI